MSETTRETIKVEMDMPVLDDDRYEYTGKMGLNCQDWACNRGGCFHSTSGGAFPHPIIRLKSPERPRCVTCGGPLVCQVDGMGYYRAKCRAHPQHELGRRCNTEEKAIQAYRELGAQMKPQEPREEGLSFAERFRVRRWVEDNPHEIAALTDEEVADALTESFGFTVGKADVQAAWEALGIDPVEPTPEPPPAQFVTREQFCASVRLVRQIVGENGDGDSWDRITTRLDALLASVEAGE